MMLMISPAMQARLARRARKAARARLRFTDRAEMVKVMAALIRADWREGVTPTLLTHEGALVAILRASLCLRRLPWTVADAEARDAVAEALRDAGAKRPSWAEGQPEWTEGGVIRETRVTCAECARPLPEGNKVWCGPLCGDRARQRRYWADLEEAERLARNLSRSRRARLGR